MEAAGASKDNFGSILSSSESPRNAKIIEIWLSSVPRDIFDEIRGIDAESRPGHFPTIGFMNREVQGQENTKFIKRGALLIGGGG